MIPTPLPPTRFRLSLLVILVLGLCACTATPRVADTPPAATQDHPRLAQIHAADQAARTTQPIDWDRVSAMDAAHRTEVLALLRAGEVRTANDLFHAAMVMQHGSETADYQLAFSLARLAMTLDPDSKRARWLSAAAWDRILMSKNVPQWYGTQFHSPGPDEPMALYEVNESAVTDEERAAMSVPSLQASREMAKKLKR